MRVRRAREAAADEPAPGLNVGPALDVQRRQEAADVAGVARCPACAAVLVARMGRRGPVFTCRCRPASPAA